MYFFRTYMYEKQNIRVTFALVVEQKKPLHPTRVSRRKGQR